MTGDADIHDHHDHHHPGSGHHPERPSPVEARARALESLLLEKGLVTTEAIDRIVDAYESDIGPLNGARVVARAWVDPGFKARLLADGAAAIRELGLSGLRGENLVVVENRPGVHNVIVCTLCSCYPWAVLGLPPHWYKSAAYRSRMVIEPREVLREFGLTLEDSTRVEVWDSSAETRYMVLPERPEGTEELGEEELAALVTRDAMVGVARVGAPARP
jgi:nitrile hydratase